MRLLDLIYLNIYWCGNLGKGGGLIDHAFGRLFYVPVSGLIMFILVQFCRLFHLNISSLALVGISVFLTYMFVERFIDHYFSDEKRKAILSQYPKPAWPKYLVLFLILFGGMAIGIAAFQASTELHGAMNQ